MSRFSQSLAQSLTRHSWTGAHLANLCGTQASTISRYTSGKVAPRPEALPELLQHFEPAEQAAMVRAFLCDIIPPQYTGLVEIVTHEADPARISEVLATCGKPTGRPDGISDELWSQICRVAELARDVPEIAAIIRELDSLIQRRASL